MKIRKLHAVAAGIASLLFVAPGRADETERTLQFLSPKRIQAGKVFLGEGRLYPSPVFHDVDGDKQPDLVVADLFGRVTFARRADAAFVAEQPLKGKDGKALKFSNW